MARTARTPEHTTAELRTLHMRLDKGWDVIDAELDPVKREQQIDFWLNLLRSYQRLADWLGHYG